MIEDDRTRITESLLTPEQAAQRLLEEATLTAYRTRGIAGLRPFKDGRRSYFRAQDVEAYLAELRAA